MPHLINLGTTWWLVSQPHSLVTSPVVTHGIGSRLCWQRKKSVLSRNQLASYLTQSQNMKELGWLESQCVKIKASDIRQGVCMYGIKKDSNTFTCYTALNVLPSFLIALYICHLLIQNAASINHTVFWLKTVFCCHFTSQFTLCSFRWLFLKGTLPHACNMLKKQHCKKLCSDKPGVSIFCAGCKQMYSMFSIVSTTFSCVCLLNI